MQQNELPEGWEEAPLEQLLMLLESGSRPKGGVRGISEGIPSIGGEHLNDNGGFRFEKVKFVSEEFFEKMNQGLIQLNDILIVKDGATTGKVSIVRRDFPYARAAVNEHVFLCRSYSLIDPYYVFYFLFSEIGQQRILNNFRGSAQGGINKSFAPNTLIPLPPLPEQHRIVTAIEALFARLDATNERLDRVPGIMKTFRQAVLAAACDGRLTEDWRLNNTSPKTLSQKDSAIPEDWSISKIKDVFEYWGGATPSTSNPSYWDGDIPWISSKDMKTWKISNGQDFITSLALENTNLRICPVNSVLVVVRSGILLHTLPIAITESEVVINQDLKAFYNQDHDLNNWLAIFLKGKSPDILYKNRKDGTTVQSIKFDDLKNMDLLIPPKGEQREIVRRLDSLFAFADSIEVKVAVAREKTERLRQSILAKAFSGELVPTEAELARQEGRNYESAEVLLERIKREGISGKK